MNLAAPITSSLLSQVYVAVLGVVLMPVYLRSLGPEAFGLISLSFLAQGWLSVLDLGLVATVTRWSSMARAGAISIEGFVSLWRVVFRSYLSIGLATLVAMILLVWFFAEHWIVHQLAEPNILLHSLLLICGVAVMRWFCELYRAVLAGFGQFVWLSSFNAAIATIRFLLVLPLIFWYGIDVVGFFVFQSAVAVLELTTLVWVTRPRLNAKQMSSNRALRSPPSDLWRFTLSMAFATSSWVLISNVDKTLLSGFMPLSEFGEFTLATFAASAVLLATAPLTAVILPQMTVLSAEAASDAFDSLFRRATQWLGLLAWPGCAVLALHSKHVLYAWTGNSALAEKFAPILQLYAIGNALLAIGAIVFIAQCARGELRLHLVGSGLFLCALVSAVVVVAPRFGGLGVAWAWFAVNLAYFIFWLPLTLRSRGPLPYTHWLRHDVVAPASGAFLCTAALSLIPSPQHRVFLIAQLLLVGLLAFFFSACGSSWAREFFREKIRGATSESTTVQTFEKK